MRKVFIFLAILGFICFAIEINALAKTIKVGAAVNLTGPASGWACPQAGPVPRPARDRHATACGQRARGQRA